jgi:cobalt-zinc-cadmium efflux system membrane fusion protein
MPSTHDGASDAGKLLRKAGVVALIGVGIALGIGAYHFILKAPDGSAFAQREPEPARPHEQGHPHEPSHQHVPYLVRTGERISIPRGSPLRDKLTIQAVGEKEIRQRLVLPAVVEADPARLVKILPPLTGRITSLKVQLGGRVEAGQELAVVDSPDLAAAYADYERAKVLLALALKNRDRQRELAKFGGAALRDQQQAETDYITAEVEHRRAEERLRQIGVDADTTNKSRTVTIKSPIAGSVIDLAVAPGAFWNDTTAALMTIADLSTVWVTANVPEKDTALITKGQAVHVAFTAYPGQDAKGDVLFISDVLDPDTRRTKVRIAFKNPDLRLKPNMFANVSFLSPMQVRPIIPTGALVFKDDRDRVFVEVEPWIFESRPVEISYQEGDQAVIAAGLKKGERVVVKGGVLLND